MTYRVIYADPPWRFATYSDQGRDRCPETRHYDTMAVEDIAALRVQDLAAPTAFLFIWVYQPMLPQALAIMTTWGFRYTTIAFIWAKQGRIGHGYYTRSGGEICLLGRCGHGRAGVKRHDIRQLIEAPVRQHSRKPDEAYERIEALLDGPYVELFARTRRTGWDVAFSNESDRFEA